MDANGVLDTANTIGGTTLPNKPVFTTIALYLALLRKAASELPA